MSRDLEPVLPGIAQPFAAYTRPSGQLSEVDFFQGKLLTLFSLHLPKRLCYSFVEVIDFIRTHNPPSGIDVVVNIKYRKV